MEQEQFRVTEPVKFTVEYDQDGQRHTLTGEGFLELRTEYINDISDYSGHRLLFSKSRESTLTISKVKKYFYVKREIKGVERTARVEVDALNEENIAHARKLAGVRTDTEFAITHGPRKSNWFIEFRWTE